MRLAKPFPKVQVGDVVILAVRGKTYAGQSLVELRGERIVRRVDSLGRPVVALHIPDIQHAEAALRYIDESPDYEYAWIETGWAVPDYRPPAEPMPEFPDEDAERERCERLLFNIGDSAKALVDALPCRPLVAKGYARIAEGVAMLDEMVEG